MEINKQINKRLNEGYSLENYINEKPFTKIVICLINKNDNNSKDISDEDFEYLNQDSILITSKSMKGKVWIADFFFTAVEENTTGKRLL